VAFRRLPRLFPLAHRHIAHAVAVHVTGTAPLHLRVILEEVLFSGIRYIEAMEILDAVGAAQHVGVGTRKQHRSCTMRDATTVDAFVVAGIHAVGRARSGAGASL